MRWDKRHCRTIRRFALFPIKCRDEYRWLEVVYIQQHFEYGVWGSSWVNDYFVNKQQWKEWRKK